MSKRIEIAKDFSRFPGGRFRADGPQSGQAFRDDILAPALTAGSVVLVLDGVAGLPSSFLEETLGGLVRNGMTISFLRERLTIVAETPRMQSYVSQAWRYIENAAGHIAA